jgi:hypothetical protein
LPKERTPIVPTKRTVKPRLEAGIMMGGWEDGCWEELNESFSFGLSRALYGVVVYFRKGKCRGDSMKFVKFLKNNEINKL